MSGSEGSYSVGRVNREGLGKLCYAPGVTLLRRSFLGGIGALGASLALPSRARSTTLVAVGIEELVERSVLVVETLPVDHRSEWQAVGDQKRIVTFTRLVHQARWLGPKDELESEVLTFGGRVGELAQKVHGEARLPVGQPVLLFLTGPDLGTRRVVGMSQGQFSWSGTGAGRRLLKSSGLPELVMPRAGKQAAVQRLHQMTLAEARALVERTARQAGR